MTRLSKDLLVNGKNQQEFDVLCPFCKNKNLQVYSAHFYNCPEIDNVAYKTLLAFFSKYSPGNENKIFCSATHVRSKNKKLYIDDLEMIRMDMFCNLCKHFSKLYIRYCDYYNDLLLTWEEPKRNQLNFIGKDVKVAFEKIKKRRPIPLGLRYKVLTRDNHTCQSCGAKASDGFQLHIDHIKPVSKGGDNSFENLQTLCRDCNLGKGDKY